MKKIVSAVALASLVAGAFAADVTIKSQIKYQPTVAEFRSAKDYSYNAYATQATTKDTVQINIKQDNVGIYGKFDATAASTVVNTAYADLALGNAKITVGRFESRFTNAVTGDANDESFIANNKGDKLVLRYNTTDNKWTTAKVAGGKKLGINPNIWQFTLDSKVGQDSDNVACLFGDKVNGGIAVDYTIADVLPGKLLLKGVAKMKTDAWDSKDNDTTKTDETHNNSAYSLEAALTHDIGTFDFVTNLDGDGIGSLAFFANIKAVENLQTVLGFTYAWYNGYQGTNKYDDKYWAIDARARYAFTEEFAAGIYANLTNITQEKDDVKSLDGVNVLDLVLNANYKINDLAKVFAEGEYSTVLTEQDGTSGKTLCGAKYGATTVAVQGGVILTPAKGCTITGAVKAGFNGVGADSDHKDFFGNIIMIPLTFNFSL